MSVNVKFKADTLNHFLYDVSVSQHMSEQKSFRVLIGGTETAPFRFVVTRARLVCGSAFLSPGAFCLA